MGAREVVRAHEKKAASCMASAADHGEWKRAREQRARTQKDGM
jgi:hypothetical protein